MSRSRPGRIFEAWRFTKTRQPMLGRSTERQQHSLDRYDPHAILRFSHGCHNLTFCMVGYSGHIICIFCWKSSQKPTCFSVCLPTYQSIYLTILPTDSGSLLLTNWSTYALTTCQTIKLFLSVDIAVVPKHFRSKTANKQGTPAQRKW